MFRIFICEDEMIVRRGLVMTTPWDKYECEVIGEAENGEDAFKKIIELRPDIVISDIKMPVLTGLELMEQVYAVYRPAFIFLTAFSQFDFAVKALKLGAIDYLLKPFKDPDLQNAIDKAKQYVSSVYQPILSETSQEMFNQIDTIELKLSNSKKSKHENLKKAIDFIKKQYDQEITVGDVALSIDMSESYLSRLFREETTYSFHEFLTIFRIKKACELLSDSYHRISEVSYAVGYRDQRYFSVVFKKYMGITPNQFKEKNI